MTFVPRLEPGDPLPTDVAFTGRQWARNAHHRAGIEATRVRDRWNAGDPQPSQPGRHVAVGALLKQNFLPVKTPIGSSRLQTADGNAVLRCLFGFAFQPT